jgi:hypothetical protein
MALSKSKIKNLVSEVLEENQDSLDIDEVEELAGLVADRFLEEDPDAYDDEEEDAQIDDEVDE